MGEERTGNSGVFRISKRGPNFRWPIVFTQRGDQTKFSKFLKRKFFFAKGRPWPIGLFKCVTDGEGEKGKI